jgi:hypothetical protein
MERTDDSTQRLRSRLGRRLLIAAVLGPAIGLAAGGVIAAIAIGTWNRAAAMVLVGAVVASTLLSLLWAGYSSLESPDPGQEPSDTQRPIADRPAFVREETEETDDAATRGLPSSSEG